jgi:ribose 5-phosphate isomerase
MSHSNLFYNTLCITTLTYTTARMKKNGLETYFLDKTNMFDIAIDKLIDEFKVTTTI